jgi:two-component system phosphate regulon sensor histidine kinase PhoR
MKSKTLRWIFLIGVAIVATLGAAQLYWLNKTYAYEKKEFTTSVIKSIKGVYEDLELTTLRSPQLQDLIEQPDLNRFLFRIDSFPSQNLLRENLFANLENFGVFTDCRVALYDHINQSHVYELYLPAAGSTMARASKPENTLTVFQRPYDYIQLYFPNRTGYILHSMIWWIVASAVLLLCLIGLGLSLFFFYRQKFLNEIQHDFIRNVTHEFQTPLTTLTIGLDALNKPANWQQPDKIQRYVTLMQGQTQYLKQHLENLVKVIQSESGRLGSERQSVCPEDLIDQACEQMKVWGEEKKAIIHVRYENGKNQLQGDANALFLVVLNLLSNALKYSTKPEIEISTWVQGKQFHFSIQDNGIGIDKKYQKKLFHKFFRVPTGDVHDVKGLGLGLYFVKKVVDQHHGQIRIESAPGKGSRFEISLPVR